MASLVHHPPLMKRLSAAIPKWVLILLLLPQHPTLPQSQFPNGWAHSPVAALGPSASSIRACPRRCWLGGCGISSGERCPFSLTSLSLFPPPAALMSPFTLERSRQEAEKNRVLTNELRVILTELNN
uniref:Tropomyosin 2 n=1 Tax=Hypotaenidia okinawae TaxID=2861861 RepID=A0A6G1RHW3_9GRUI